MAIKDVEGVPRPGMFEKIKLFSQGEAHPVSRIGNMTKFEIKPPPPPPNDAPPPPPKPDAPPPPPPPLTISSRTADPMMLDIKAQMAKDKRDNPDATGLLGTKMFMKGPKRG